MQRISLRIDARYQQSVEAFQTLRTFESTMNLLATICNDIESNEMLQERTSNKADISSSGITSHVAES
jgi:hypothetical protein